MLTKVQKPVKVVYTMMNNARVTKLLIGKYNKFCKGLELTYEKYLKAFTNLSKITRIMKYRNFQYHLLLNAIYTNNQLFH